MRMTDLGSIPPIAKDLFAGQVILFLIVQRSTAVQVRSSVRLMPQIQPSSRGLLLSPIAWLPDQHLAAMLADVSRYILGRTEGRGLGFGQLVRGSSHIIDSTRRANAQMIQFCHTGLHSHLPYKINHHEHFSCFMQLYNSMTAQVLAFP